MRYGDGLPCDGQGAWAFFPRPLNLQFEGGARLSAQHLAHGSVFHSLDILVIDAQDDIARLEPRQVTGTSLVWFADDHAVLFLVEADDGTYACVLALRHGHEFVIVLGVIHRVGINLTEHGIDAPGHHRVGVERVHVEEVQLTVYLRECLQVAHEAAVVVL